MVEIWAGIFRSWISWRKCILIFSKKLSQIWYLMNCKKKKKNAIFRIIHNYQIMLCYLMSIYNIFYFLKVNKALKTVLHKRSTLNSKCGVTWSKTYVTYFIIKLLMLCYETGCCSMVCGIYIYICYCYNLSIC